MSELIKELLAYFGGASIIVFAFTNKLGEIWANRIAQQTIAKYDQQLQTLKSEQQLLLEKFKINSQFALNDSEFFNGISKEIYENFFKERIKSYLRLLELKNKYITDMNEDFVTDEHERWGDVYYYAYEAFRKVLIENQLYISNELESSFNMLRDKASAYIKEADRLDAYAQSRGMEPYESNEEKSPIYQKFAQETNLLMQGFLEKISLDVSKIRSRIDLDKI